MGKTVMGMLLFFCMATAASADNFRCPNGSIVSTGDNISIVSMKCDPPTYKNSRTESEEGF